MKNNITDASPLETLESLKLLELTDNDVTQDSIESVAEGGSRGSLEVLRYNNNYRCTSLAFSLDLPSLKELSATGIQFVDPETLTKLKENLNDKLDVSDQEEEELSLSLSDDE